tara:strand:+ start:138471 stop:139730 length:1260 start_codon:yes stop_codon:yes gene_type:complete
VFEKLLRIVFNFILMIFITRYLGAHDFGILSFGLVIIQVFIPLSTCGMDQLIRKKLISSGNKDTDLVSTIFLFRTALGLVFSLLIGFFYLFDSSQQNLLILLLGLGLAFKGSMVFEIWFDSKIESKETVFPKITGFVVSGVLQLIAIYLKAPLWFFGLCFSFEWIITFLLFLNLLRKKEAKINLSFFDYTLLKGLLVQSKSIFLSDIFTITFMKFNIFFANYFLTKTAVGQLGLAIRLTDLWLFIPVSIGVSFFNPIIKSFKEGTKAEWHKWNQTLTEQLTFISITLAIAGTLLGPYLIPRLFGEDFIPSINLFLILIWSNIFSFWGFAIEPWEIAQNKLSYRLFRVCSSAVLNILLNLYLIPKYNISGAVYATLITSIYINTLVHIFKKDTREILYFQLRSFTFKELRKGLKSPSSLS